MPNALAHRHPHGRHELVTAAAAGSPAAASPAAASPAAGSPAAAAHERKPAPAVGLVFRDGGEVVLDRGDERVAPMVAVAGVLAEGTPDRTTSAANPGDGASTVPGDGAATKPGDGAATEPGVVADVSEGAATAAQPRPSAAHRRRAAWARLVAAVRRWLRGGRR